MRTQRPRAFVLLWTLGVLACGEASLGSSEPDLDDRVGPADQGDTGIQGPDDLGVGQDPGSPTLTELVEGDGQSAIVDTSVAVAPRLRVTDSDGIPVPDVEAIFSVLEGGGAVEGAVVRTDDAGTAAPARWVLGPTPGLNRLMGEVPGLAPIFFEATGLPDASGSFIIDAGNYQSAQINSAVEVAPRVRITTQGGASVLNRSVTFEVGTGNGSVEGAVAMTDTEGRASVGAWILGPEPGAQTLIARTNGLPDLTFEAVAVAADAPILSNELWITDIGRPWDLAFLPDGTMLITERDGRIRAVDPGSRETRVVLEPPEDLVVQGQSGMLGIAIDPDFETNRYVYAFMASDRAGATDNRIRRWTLSLDGDALVEDRDILTDMTYASSGAHSGGRIRFGPDGNLWITTGDTRRATVPQDVRELGGKILRVTRDGNPAPGNPSIQGARPEIFFVGVRNPQGITFRPGTGEAFICEHGPNQDDEITRLVAGGNGGWNPNDGEGNYNGYTGALMSDPSIPGVIQPSYKVSDSQGMSGCDFLVGTQWRGWDQSLLVGMLGGTRALVVLLDGAGTGTREDPTVVLDTTSRIRSIVMGRDGYAYVAIDENPGTIWRVTAE